MTERQLDIREIEKTLLDSPFRNRDLGINTYLLLDAWENKGLFGWRNTSVTQVLSRPASSLPEWYLTDYHSYLDLYRYDLEQLRFTSITEFLLIGYANNMRNFDLLGISLNSSVREFAKQNVAPTLPPTLSLFMVDCLERTKMSQRSFADSVDSSQALISNMKTGKISVWLQSVIRVIERMDLDPTTKAAAIMKYSDDPKVNNKRVDPDQVERYFQGVLNWVNELEDLDHETLVADGFSCIEEFLLARFVNTTSLTIDLLDLVPTADDPEQLKGEFIKKSLVPNISRLNNLPKGASVFLNAWALRGLYHLPRVKEDQESENISIDSIPNLDTVGINGIDDQSTWGLY